MKLNYVAAAPLALISLFNLPIAFDPGDIPAGIAWAISSLGVVGFIAVIALLKERRWDVPMATAVAAVNLIAAGLALTAHQQGAIVGLVLSALAIAGTTTILARRHTSARRATI